MLRFGIALAILVVLVPVRSPADSFVAKTSYAPEDNPVELVLDASRAANGIVRVNERIPATAGAFTLVYPKWIPGEHGPTGPLNDLAALRISANGSQLDWHRDPIDMYAFRVNVPRGVHWLDVEFYVLLNGPDDVTSSHSVAIVNWNRALLYQSGIDSHQYFVRPSIILPPGWQYATAVGRMASLAGALPLCDRLAGVRFGSSADRCIDFATTALDMLVDSPIDMGRYAKSWTLWHEGSTVGARAATAAVELDAFADYPQDLDIPPNLLHAYERMPAETFAMYGSRHFANYYALLTLSDAIGFEGIEHHQSSDNRAPDDFLTNPQESLADGDLVTHEFSHSWNGKYRRPADLTTPNFQVPQQTDLLWIYEGLNQYLGDVLSFRSGIREPRLYAEYLATLYARLDYETGRTTTPLIDLTTGAPYFFEARGDYGAIRRSAGDFYDEGELLWLDVDTIVRERSHGARSLDTFLHRYTEPALSGPIVVTYTRAQIEALLSEVEPYDWHAFFEKYVYQVSAHPPTDELARAGWRMVYTEKPNAFITADNTTRHSGITAWYGFGANLDKDGKVKDVRENSAAWRAGLAPGMQIVAVNGQQFSTDSLDYALRTAQHSNAPISLIATQTGWFQTLPLDYHDGARYPHLERIQGTSDMLAEIVAPHAR